MTKRPFNAKGYKAKDLLELVYLDVYGPMFIQTRGGYEYFVTFTDDYSRFGYVYLINESPKLLKSSKSLGLKLKINWVNA